MDQIAGVDHTQAGHAGDRRPDTAYASCIFAVPVRLSGFILLQLRDLGGFDIGLDLRNFGIIAFGTKFGTKTGVSCAWYSPSLLGFGDPDS